MSKPNDYASILKDHEAINLDVEFEAEEAATTMMSRIRQFQNDSQK